MTFSELKCFISIKKFNAHDHIKTELLTMIENSKFKNILVNEDTYNISKCDWEFSDNFNREYVRFFIDDLCEHLMDIGKQNFFKDLKINKLWFQQYSENDVHGWHIHGDCQFTGVYYLNLPDNAPKTKILEPFTKTIIELDIHEGDIAIFPSFLLHKAPKINLDIKKTIISFNFNYDDVSEGGLEYLKNK